MKIFKVGGMRFFRIGRLQFSFCVCRTDPVKRVKKHSGRTLARAVRNAYNLGYARGCSVWPERTLQIAAPQSAINRLDA